MNILIDIAHPAHVHLYKNFIKQASKKGDIVFVTVKKNLYAAKKLLSIYDIPYFELAGKLDSLWGKILSQLLFDIQLLLFVIKNKIDIGLGGSITITHVSRISKMKSIVFDDDDDIVQPLFVKFAHPFCDSLLSPEILIGKRKQKDTIFYPGLHELAYLHPNYFTPNLSVLSEAGIVKGEMFFILRFNAFRAHHDIRVKGLSIDQKRSLVEMLSKKGKVFITTENKIENEFMPYQLKISPEKIHSLLYYATMFIGDSQTMTSEAAVLGTPAIRSNSFVGQLSVLEELEHKYDLAYGFLPHQYAEMKNKINFLLSIPNLKQEWILKREKLLNDKIDLTSFICWFVENYPNSNNLMNDKINLKKLYKKWILL